MTAQELGQLIRKERNKQSVTLVQLARKIKDTQGNLSAIENGERNITLSTLNKIAKGLGMKLTITFDE